jgi:hypothetical protein
MTGKVDKNFGEVIAPGWTVNAWIVRAWAIYGVH